MRSRLTKFGAALVALAALAVGGSALASANGGGSSPAKAPAVLNQQAPPVADAESNDSAAESIAESAESGNPNADTQQQGEH